MGLETKVKALLIFQWKNFENQMNFELLKKYSWHWITRGVNKCSTSFKTFKGKILKFPLTYCSVKVTFTVWKIRVLQHPIMVLFQFFNQFIASDIYWWEGKESIRYCRTLFFRQGRDKVFTLLLAYLCFTYSFSHSFKQVNVFQSVPKALCVKAIINSIDN